MSDALLPLKVAGPLRVVDYVVEEYVDAIGEDSLKVHAILDDATDGAQRSWATVEPIERAIRDAVAERGDPRFVQTWFGTRADFDRRYLIDDDGD